MSPVILVISVEAPISSSCEKDSLLIWSKRLFLTSVAKPTDALAAKYCAISVQASPNTPNKTISRLIFIIYGLSERPIPLSIILATKSGIVSSNATSTSLNTGDSILSFL